MTDNSFTKWTSMSDKVLAENIGKFVRYHRMEQNKTQDELAKDAGISRSTLSLLERGETVTVASLIQILRVLDLLHIMDVFTIVKQQSPLMLALEEKKKRQRAVGREKKSTDTKEEIDW